jgi:hypothetical protein
MKIVEKSDATGSLGDYAGHIGEGPVVVTSEGEPMAVLLPIGDSGLESISLGTNQRFLELIDRSRSRARTEGGISSEDMRRRFE